MRSAGCSDFMLGTACWVVEVILQETIDCLLAKPWSV
jgi:hypothetical protein